MMTPTQQLAQWMIEHSFATGHGDKFTDLLNELSWQVAELRAAPAVTTYAAGGPHSANALRAGAASCLLVAGFKEGSDALAGADTPKQAFIHASTITVGCGAMIVFNH